MTPERGTAALLEMLHAWGRTVAQSPQRSPVPEQSIISLIARCEARLERGATAADVLLLELVPFLETTAEAAPFDTAAIREHVA